MSDVLTLSEAAHMLGMSKQTLSLKARAGEVKGSRPTKAWRFIRLDLLNYLRSSYDGPRRALTSKEDQQCHFQGREAGFGGSTSEEYAIFSD